MLKIIKILILFLVKISTKKDYQLLIIKLFKYFILDKINYILIISKIY